MHLYLWRYCVVQSTDVDFPDISLIRWSGSGDTGQVLVVRTELRQRDSKLDYTMLNSLALGSGVACYRLSRS